jgi:hypothetical protein
MKVPRIKKLPKHIQREIDTRLIESGFSGYEMLATELQHRGCRISTSALHRYGQTLEKQIQDARAREIAIEAGIQAQGAPPSLFWIGLTGADA